MNKYVSTRRLALWVLLMALLIWLPRGFELDRFVTADEHAWLTRSGNFYRALTRGDYAATFQRHHPGVTVTWAGTLGFLSQYPNYAQDAPTEFGWLSEEIEPFLRSQGHSPIDMLAAGRHFIVLFITVALAISFWLTVRLLGLPTALLGFGLIAFSPFHVGLSRLMHLDGLLSAFMLLSMLAFLTHLKERDRGSSPWCFLILSAVAGGLAWLTRSPGLFLGPFLFLVTLTSLFTFKLSSARDHKFCLYQLTVEKLMVSSQPQYSSSSFNIRTSRQLLIQFAIWALIGGILFVGLWPAMWVAPFQSIGEVLNAAQNYAAEGHLKPLFFDGQVVSGDPGWRFYPISFLWRTTPVTLTGLALAILSLWFVIVRALFTTKKNLSKEILSKEKSFVLATFVCYSLLFAFFMNVGDKKFDRYLLPAYLPLLIVAGWGWATALRSILRQSRLFPVLGTAVIAGQVLFALPTFPYYLSFYNPLMGGTARAPEVMQIGWGEGADQAAAVLNQKLAQEDIDATQITVASAYTNGPFSYFFEGETLPIYFWNDADYAILYAQDIQRRLPGPRQIRYFETIAPMDTIQIDGLMYARIFDLQAAPLPPYVTDWQIPDSDVPQIRLVSYLFPSSKIEPGDTLPMTLYFKNLAPVESDLSVLVQLVGSDGVEIARSEGWPQGRPTSTWVAGDTWADGHSLVILPETPAGIYRLDVSFYDPASLEQLVATRPLTQELLGNTLQLDFVEIGGFQGQPQSPIDPVAEVGTAVALTGQLWLDAGGSEIDPTTHQFAPGEQTTLMLSWSVRDFMERNYTIFAHVISPDGSVLTQMDEQPWGGFYPTSFWSRGRTIAQPLLLTIPEDATAGDYAVHVGMYDSETVTRLPITRDGTAEGDSVTISTLKVNR